MGGVVYGKTILAGIKVDLILLVPDGVDVVLHVLEAVFEEGADKAGSLGCVRVRDLFVLTRGGKYRSPGQEIHFFRAVVFD